MENRPRRPAIILPERFEAIAGWIYLPLYLFFLSIVIGTVCALLGIDIRSEQMQLHINVAYGAFNFIVVALIFRRYLSKSFRAIGHYPGRFCAALFGGFGIYQIGTPLVTMLTELICPTLENVNNASLVTMGRTGKLEMLVYAVLLVPMVEECLFRGLLFTSIRRRSRAAAYAVSIAVFSGIHVLGYIGAYPIGMLALCFLQYIPAGFALAWALEFSGSIWASIGIHTLANLTATIVLILMP